MSDVCTLCGLPVSRASLSSHLRDLIDRMGRGAGAWLVTLNTEMVSRGAREPAYWSLVKQADIITADGMPLVWASGFKFPGAAIEGRTTGVDLVDAMLRMEDVPRFAVIGGQQPLKTIELYGQGALNACGFVFDGKVDLSEAQLNSFCDALIKHQVKVLFLALGVPKQDELALQMRQRLPHLVMLGIGGTFEILGPQGRRAPTWMQKTGLEWLYRFLREPLRLWRRYLLSYPRGVWVLMLDCLRPAR
jgi:N-acetylglucosaminyldiphosphoundecaprenol N-acetyl-beta-D-mannosaminyltransferase